MTNEKKVKSRVHLSALSYIIIVVHNINNRYIHNHHSVMNYHNITVSTMLAYAEYWAPKNMILYRSYLRVVWYSYKTIESTEPPTSNRKRYAMM